MGWRREKKESPSLPFFFWSLRVTCHKETASPRNVRRACPKPPENAKIAFRWGWHKLEMPSHSGGPPRLAKHPRSAPPRSVHINVSWIPPLQKADRERYTTAPRSVQRLPGLAQNRYQDSAYLAMGLRPAGGHRRSNTAVGDPVAASKMRFSPSSPPGTNFRCPVSPLVRPSQTRLGHPARTPADRGTCDFGEGGIGSDHPRGRSTLRTPSAFTTLGWTP